MLEPLQFWDAPTTPKATTSRIETNSPRFANWLSGIRVQSHRGNYGRVPMVGRLPHCSNVWIFTGLSSRGLLHHALYARHLVDGILASTDPNPSLGTRDEAEATPSDLDWWFTGVRDWYDKRKVPS